VNPGAVTAARVGTTFTGTATPGASVSVLEGPWLGGALTLGRTTADARGRWSIPDGVGVYGPLYARSEVPADPGHPRVFVSNTVQVTGT
jgi:hypothetical protein